MAGIGGQTGGQIAGCGGPGLGRGAGTVGARRDGWGSAEATEMVLNNLFYITAKVSLLFFLPSPKCNYASVTKSEFQSCFKII